MRLRFLFFNSKPPLKENVGCPIKKLIIDFINLFAYGYNLQLETVFCSFNLIMEIYAPYISAVR